MSVILLGANGLVGSAFARFFDKNNVPFVSVQRENMYEIAGTTCDLVINCSGNGNKGRANSDPAWDFQETVGSAAHYVHAIKTNQFVHISSVDVYADPASLTGTQETAAVISQNQSVYGFHKFLAEQYVQQFSGKALVLRLPALVGPGLKKNPIFDHFNDDKKLFIAAESHLNVVHTDFVAAATWQLLQQDLTEPVLNLAARDSMTIGELPNISGIGNVFHDDAHTNCQRYSVNTEAIGRYLDLPTSQMAIQQYMEDIGR